MPRRPWHAQIAAWLARESQAGRFVSELVTNGVRHAQFARDEPLHLTTSLHDGTLRLELRDTGTGGSVSRQPPRTEDHAGVFGLNLVAQLSNEWGVQRAGDGTRICLVAIMRTVDAAGRPAPLLFVQSDRVGS